MNIQVWYKVPASPPIENRLGEIVVVPDHVIATRIYQAVRFRIDQGLLIIEHEAYPHGLVAVYSEFDRVEPTE